MKLKLILFSVILSVHGFKSFSACGGWGPIYIDFYEIFIADGNRPTPYDAINQANIKAWEKYFSGEFDDVYPVVYQYSVDEMEFLIQQNKKKKIREGLHYLKYAKEIQSQSNRFNIRSGSWDYYTILDDFEYKEELFERGVEGFKNTKSREIKLRYAYQVIRYLHYSGKYKEAIDFFEQNTQPSDNQYEIYYYCLDQIGGCHFSLGEQAKAAYSFLQVYMYSGDRKIPALNSFRIYYGWDFNKLLAMCKSDKEKAYAKTLVTGTYYNLYDAEWVMNNAYDEEVLLSIYYYDKVYEQGRYNWLNTNNFRYLKWDDEENIELTKSIDMLSQIADHPKSTKADFWNLSRAYLAYVKGDFGQASEYATKANSPIVVNKGRLEFFKEFFNVAKDGIINDKVENAFYNFHLKYVESELATEKNFREDMYFTLLKLYYLYNDKVMKANLISMTKGDVDQIYELDQLDNLKKLYEDEDKNSLESFLLNKVFGTKLNITDYITEKKGSYYLMKNEFKKALELFKKLPKDYGPKLPKGWVGNNYQFNGYSNVPAEVFSANINEGFDYNMSYIMTDKIFKNAQFSFIKDTFSKKELTEYLIKLTDQADNGSSNAHYLLGNYYYNTSGLGYFRNLLVYYPDNNNCSYCYSTKLIDNYNSVSYLHYQKALAKTTDREAQAKITYMMAKNVAYDWKKDKKKKVYFSLFYSLVNEYKDTDFYKDIIVECGQFNYYAFNLYPAKEGKRGWY